MPGKGLFDGWREVFTPSDGDAIYDTIPKEGDITVTLRMGEGGSSGRARGIEDRRKLLVGCEVLFGLQSTWPVAG